MSTSNQICYIYIEAFFIPVQSQKIKTYYEMINTINKARMKIKTMTELLNLKIDLDWGFVDKVCCLLKP